MVKKTKKNGFKKIVEKNQTLITIALIILIIIYILNYLPQAQPITCENFGGECRVICATGEVRIDGNGLCDTGTFCCAPIGTTQPDSSTEPDSPTEPDSSTEPDSPETTSDIHWWECEANRISYDMDYQNITPRTSSACQTYGTTYCSDIGMEYDGLAFISPNCCMWNCKEIAPTGTNFTSGECASIANATGKGWSQILFTHTEQACYDWSEDICVDYGWFLADAVYYPNNCCVWNCN